MIHNISNDLWQRISSTIRYQLPGIDKQNESYVTSLFKEIPIIRKFISCAALEREWKWPLEETSKSECREWSTWFRFNETDFSYCLTVNQISVLSYRIFLQFWWMVLIKFIIYYVVVFIIKTKREVRWHFCFNKRRILSSIHLPNCLIRVELWIEPKKCYISSSHFKYWAIPSTTQVLISNFKEVLSPPPTYFALKLV